MRWMVRADASGLVGEIRLSKQELDRLGREAQRSGARAGRARRGWAVFGREMEASRRRATALRLAMIALATGGAARVGASFLSAASDAEELRSQFAAVFRELTAEARAWARAHAEAVGRSSLDIEQYLATLQDTFVPLGFARREAFGFSRTLAQLGVDLARFKNAAEPETIDLLTSAIVGNHEAVRRFGIVITESTLKQELMNAGIAGGVQAATEQDKVLARLRIILRSTGDAQGDAARTADQYANRVRALTGDWRDFQVLFGQSLIPAAQTGIALLRDLLRELSDGADPDRLGREIEDRFRSVLLGAAGAADAVAAPLDIVTTVVNELATAFNKLPPWVQEIGLLGAVLLGRKGRLALLGTIAAGEIVGDLEDQVGRMQAGAGARQGKADRERLGRMKANRERLGLEDPTLQEQRLQARIEARAAARSRAGAGSRPDDGPAPLIDLAGGSLIGIGQGGGGPGAQEGLEDYFRRLDEERRRSAQAGPTKPRPLPLPKISAGTGPGAGGAGGAGGFEDVLGATAGLAAAQRAVGRVLRRAAGGPSRCGPGDRGGRDRPRDALRARHRRNRALARRDPGLARPDGGGLRRARRPGRGGLSGAHRQGRRGIGRAPETGRRRTRARGLRRRWRTMRPTRSTPPTRSSRPPRGRWAGMEDALVDFVRTGRLSFSSLVDSDRRRPRAHRDPPGHHRAADQRFGGPVRRRRRRAAGSAGPIRPATASAMPAPSPASAGSPATGSIRACSSARPGCMAAASWATRSPPSCAGAKACSPPSRWRRWGRRLPSPSRSGSRTAARRRPGAASASFTAEDGRRVIRHRGQRRWRPAATLRGRPSDRARRFAAGK